MTQIIIASVLMLFHLKTGMKREKKEYLLSHYLEGTTHLDEAYRVLGCVFLRIKLVLR